MFLFRIFKHSISFRGDYTVSTRGRLALTFMRVARRMSSSYLCHSLLKGDHKDTESQRFLGRMSQCASRLYGRYFLLAQGGRKRKGRRVTSARPIIPSERLVCLASRIGASAYYGSAIWGATHTAESCVAGPFARAARTNSTVFPARGVRSTSTDFMTPSQVSVHSLNDFRTPASR
jgi:hypothetical protein